MKRFLPAIAVISVVSVSTAAALGDAFFVGGGGRPLSSASLHVGVGTFVSYELVAKSSEAIVRERLLVRDASGKIRDLTLLPNSTLDGIVVHCDASYTGYAQDVVQNEHFCSSLPKPLMPGVTRLAFIWWQPSNSNPSAHLFPQQGETTDELLTLP